MTRYRIHPWPPLPPSVHWRASQQTLPFPLEDPRCRLFARARHALWQAVRSLGLRPGDQVLVPAYHHGSEVEALSRAGVELRFYDVGETLEPDEASLEDSTGPGVRALLLTHYMGFPQKSERWRRWCDDRGLLLIEDAAQAWLATTSGTPVGALGDASVFCLYKSVGVPDGAAVICRSGVPPPRSGMPTGMAGLARRHVAWLEHRLLLRRTSLPPHWKYDPEADFALGDPYSPPTPATAALLPRPADDRVADRRRSNYRFLLQELSGAVTRSSLISLPARVRSWSRSTPSANSTSSKDWPAEASWR